MAFDFLTMRTRHCQSLRQRGAASRGVLLTLQHLCAVTLKHKQTLTRSVVKGSHRWWDPAFFYWELSVIHSVTSHPSEPDSESRWTFVLFLLLFYCSLPHFPVLMHHSHRANYLYLSSFLIYLNEASRMWEWAVRGDGWQATAAPQQPCASAKRLFCRRRRRRRCTVNGIDLTGIGAEDRLRPGFIFIHTLYDLAPVVLISRHFYIQWPFTRCDKKGFEDRKLIKVEEIQHMSYKGLIRERLDSIWVLWPWFHLCFLKRIES